MQFIFEKNTKQPHTHPLRNTTEKRYLWLKQIKWAPPKDRLYAWADEFLVVDHFLLTLALPDNDPPPPPTQMVAGISLSPFSILTFSVRNHPSLTFPLLSLHFLTLAASWYFHLLSLHFLTPASPLFSLLFLSLKDI